METKATNRASSQGVGRKARQSRYATIRAGMADHIIVTENSLRALLGTEPAKISHILGSVNYRHEKLLRRIDYAIRTGS